MQGNGFITDTSIISKYRLSDANTFFSLLLHKPYVDKVGSLSAADKVAKTSTAQAHGQPSTLTNNIRCLLPV
jgi:hypothetical protein